MRIGYMRVSTDEQRHDRQGDGLAALCDELHVETLSAAGRKRPVYDAVIARLRPGDTMVIWDLDRAWRSTVDALQEADKLRERGIGLKIATMNVDTSTEFGELLYTVVAAFARFERRILSRRTREGMEAARRRGKRIGRPYALEDCQVEAAREELALGRATVKGLADAMGCSRDTLAKALKRVGANGAGGADARP